MYEVDILLPLPSSRRNADDMGLPVSIDMGLPVSIEPKVKRVNDGDLVKGEAADAEVVEVAQCPE